MDRIIRHIEPKKLLDIGANIGDFTKNILREVPNCIAVMVEANPYCEPYLKTVGQQYEIVGLSDKVGVFDLFVENNNPVGTGASFYKENTQWYEEGNYHSIQVNTQTLDSLSYFDGSSIDLIKLDVQGSELDIINGGLSTITRAKYVLIEVSLLQYNEGAPLMDAVVEKMTSLNFSIADIVEYHKMNNVIFQLDILFKNQTFLW